MGAIYRCHRRTAKNNCSVKIRPEMTLRSQQDVKIQELTNCI